MQAPAGYLYPYVQFESEAQIKLCPTYISNIFNNRNSSYSLRQSEFSISRYNIVIYGKYSLRYPSL